MGSYRSVSQGEAIFGPTIAKRLISYFATLKPATPPPSVQPFPELTESEQEILGLMAQHLTNSEIAERLVLSPKTDATMSPTSSANCRWLHAPGKQVGDEIVARYWRRRSFFSRVANLICIQL
jgi:hypothetical protein